MRRYLQLFECRFRQDEVERKYLLRCDVCGIWEVKNAVISAAQGANCRTCSKTSSIEFKVFSNVILIFQHFWDYKINCEKEKTKYFQRNFPINYQHHPFRQQSFNFPSSILSELIIFQQIFRRSSSVKRRRRKANFFFSCCQLSHPCINNSSPPAM